MTKTKKAVKPTKSKSTKVGTVSTAKKVKPVAKVVETKSKNLDKPVKKEIKVVKEPEVFQQEKPAGKPRIKFVIQDEPNRVRVKLEDDSVVFIPKSEFGNYEFV